MQHGQISAYFGVIGQLPAGGLGEIFVKVGRHALLDAF